MEQFWKLLLFNLLTLSISAQEISWYADATNLGRRSLGNNFRGTRLYYDNFQISIEGDESLSGKLYSYEKIFLNNDSKAVNLTKKRSALFREGNTLRSGTVGLLRYFSLLTFESSNGEKLQSWIKLSNEVKLFPVYVYIFLEEGEEIPEYLSFNQVRSWFDAPLVYFDSDDQTLKPLKIPTLYQVNLDRIFLYSKVQFRLVSYKTIVDNDLAKEILGQVDRAFLPSSYHAENQKKPGIHIYFGKSARDNNFGKFIGGPCGAEITRNDGIVINHEEIRERPAGLAHEIGHYFGLKHTYPESSRDNKCGPDLVSPDKLNENLMININYMETKLTGKQDLFIYEMAKKYYEFWDNKISLR